MSPYYYVYNPLGRAPRVRHQSVADAQIEAERLADLHPDSCFEILMCLGHAKTHSATVRARLSLLVSLSEKMKLLNTPRPDRRAHHFCGRKITFPCGLEVELEALDHPEKEEKTRQDNTTFLRFACPHCGQKKKIQIKLNPDRKAEIAASSAFRESLANVLGDASLTGRLKPETNNTHKQL